MYCAACGLGEVLPSGPLYSTQDAPAAGTVALITKDWDLFKSGAEAGANFDEFQEAVRFGWVPDTPEGYDRFQAYRTSASVANLNAVPEFFGWVTAWDWAYALAHGSTNWPADYAPTLWANTLKGWTANGMSAAAASTADAAFRRYFPGYLVKFGGPAAPAFPSTTAAAPAPDPAYPVGVALLLAAPPGGYSYDQATAIVLGFRRVTVLTDGTSQLSPWQPTPVYRTVLPVEWRGGVNAAAGIWGARWVGLDPDNSTDDWKARAAAALAVPASEQERVADTAAFDAWLQGLLPNWKPSGVGVVAPLAPAPPVPYIPGSQVFVPAPGTGGETTIILPGTTTPVQVSSLTPQQIATETPGMVTGPPPQPSTPGSEAGLPSTPVTSVAPGSAPGAYAAPGGPYVSPVPPSPGSPVPAQAGLGKGLLIGGGILAAVLLLGTRRRGRPRGYRRY